MEMNKPIINLSIAAEELGRLSFKVAGFMKVNIHHLNFLRKLKRQLKRPKSDIKELIEKTKTKI